MAFLKDQKLFRLVIIPAVCVFAVLAFFAIGEGIAIKVGNAYAYYSIYSVQGLGFVFIPLIFLGLGSAFALHLLQEKFEDKSLNLLLTGVGLCVATLASLGQLIMLFIRGMNDLGYFAMALLILLFLACGFLCASACYSYLELKKEPKKE